MFRAEATTYSDRRAVEHITHYSSTTGKPIAKDHQYELILVYNNTTAEDIDAMAIMYLYLHDKRFDVSRVNLKRI